MSRVVHDEVELGPVLRRSAPILVDGHGVQEHRPDGIAPEPFGGKYISMAKMSGDFPRITSSVPLFWCASWRSARLPAAVLHEVSHAVDRARGRAHCSLALALLATEGGNRGRCTAWVFCRRWATARPPSFLKL